MENTQAIRPTETQRAKLLKLDNGINQKPNAPSERKRKKNNFSSTFFFCLVCVMSSQLCDLKLTIR